MIHWCLIHDYLFFGTDYFQCTVPVKLLHKLQWFIYLNDSDKVMSEKWWITLLSSLCSMNLLSSFVNLTELLIWINQSYKVMSDSWWIILLSWFSSTNQLRSFINHTKWFFWIILSDEVMSNPLLIILLRFKLQWMIHSYIRLIWWAQAQYYLCVHKWDPSP